MKHEYLEPEIEEIGTVEELTHIKGILIHDNPTHHDLLV